jgi:hypothetical protein
MPKVTTMPPGGLPEEFDCPVVRDHTHRLETLEKHDEDKETRISSIENDNSTRKGYTLGFRIAASLFLAGIMALLIWILNLVQMLVNLHLGA